MSYRAPVQDMLFNMQHLAELDALAQLPGLADANSETAGAVLDECARFAEGVLAPLNYSADQAPSRLENGEVITSAGFQAAYEQLRAGGWQGLQHPADFGGQGLPKTIGAACSEMFASANLSFSLVSFTVFCFLISAFSPILLYSLGFHSYLKHLVSRFPPTFAYHC